MSETISKINNSKKFKFILSLSGIFIILVIWLIISHFELVDPIFLSKPLLTLKSLSNLIIQGEIINDIFISFFRVMAGFLLALFIGLPLGIACAIFPALSIFIDSNISILRFIPVAAFIPLAILWFGVSEAEKIFLIFIGVLPFLLLYISSAATNVEKEFIEVAITLGLSKKNILRKVILPRILPQIWDICRIEMAGAWSFVILAEVIAANSGLGYKLVLAQRFLHISNIFAIIIIIGLIGFLIDLIFRASFNKLFPWAEKSKLA